MGKKFNQIIGDQIRIAREEKGISCQQMADYLKCAKSTYSYYERGMYSISIENIIRISNYLGLNWVEIVNNANKK